MRRTFGTLHATSHSWTPADHLRVGDRLQSRSGRTLPIAALHAYTARKVTYNLSVQGVHTYYVEAGGTPVLVHNCAAARIRISPAASDWATKGAHIHVGSSEIRVFPTGNSADGGLGFEGIRLSTGMASPRDIETARAALMNDSALREDLIGKATSAMSDMNDHNWGNSVNRGAEMNFLIKALKAMGSSEEGR